MRRRIGALLLLAAFACFNQSAGAHAGLRRASPLEGAALGDTPETVQLSFLEKPEAALSVIRVLDSAGASHEIGRPEIVSGDPFSLTVRLHPLDRGVYTVVWRVVSALDGHATAGVYAFGVRASPAGVAAASTTYPPPSRLEMLARWILIAGLVGLAGAAFAGLAQFGDADEILVGAVAWMLALLGCLLLAEAQRRNAATSFAALFSTSVGRALLWRALAVAIAGVALAVARRPTRSTRRLALACASLAAFAGMLVHSAAGHAAAGQWRLAGIGAQWAHFAATGVWFGGLTALLVAVRGTPSDVKTHAVRRFSNVAAIALVIVAATAAIRAFDELNSWRELATTDYGRMIVVKTMLFAAIATCGAVNRWRGVPAASTSLDPLRRTAVIELLLAACAVGAAAALGTLPPPAATTGAGRIAGLSASASDFATTLRVQLTAMSDEPGPNRFTVRAVDYDSSAPVRARQVSLRFTPLDDPSVEPTSLVLTPGPDGTYAGSGANLAFDGLWRVAVRVERDASSVEVPLDLEVRGPAREVVVARPPGQPPTYTIEIPGAGVMRFSPDSERPGPAHILVTCFDFIGDPLRIETLVATASGQAPARIVPVRHLDRGRFVADLELQAGRNTISAAARTAEGIRLRASIALDARNNYR